MVQTLNFLWLWLRTSQKGVTTVEYAVMLALVAIIVATTSPNISQAVTGVFQNAITAMNNPGGS